MKRSLYKKNFSGILALIQSLGLIITIVIFTQCKSSSNSNLPIVRVSKQMATPAWAVLERQILETQGKIAEQWERAYLGPDSTTDVKFIHGGGTKAPDDFFETIWPLPLAYALGAPKLTVDTYWKAWKGSLKQLAEQGLIVNEMAKYLDWHHNGEHYEGFWLMSLCLPNDPEYIRLSLKYASFYDGTNPKVPNYDSINKVIRSMNSGGAGPIIDCRINHWTEEIVFNAGNGTRAGYQEQVEIMKKQLEKILARQPKLNSNISRIKGRVSEPAEIKALRDSIRIVDFWSKWLDCAHDGPVNLVTTCFGTNAFLLTGNENYRRRTMEYIDAWRDRAKANRGIVPSIVKNDGTVPKEWWGGVMGWDFKPFGGLFQVSSGPRAAWGNALLLTGDTSYFRELRHEADEIWEHRFESKVSGVKAIDVPRYRGAEGWYGQLLNGQRGGANSAGIYASLLANVFMATMSAEDLQRILDRPVDGGNGHSVWQDERGWIQYLIGKDPDWVEKALTEELSNAKGSLASLQKHPGYGKDPSLNMLSGQASMCPAYRLVNCMTGGLAPLWHGQLLLSRFRYFDPERKRPGITEDCAALVETLTDESATLVLVNTNPDKSHKVLVQTGMYAEHQCISVEPEGDATVTVNGPIFAVKLAPGTGQRLIVRMKRYANTPTAKFLNMETN